ncbi:MAG TPA: TetR/AcrR family transcriptional regulator [Kofleriaceae bacterium]|nr:TetR/AcrR family transcriptional regulator [Kofleriaceae bacterium]
MNLDSIRRRRMALRTQMREKVRAAILDAAEELIAEKGLQGTALTQIAAKAGVAVGTLYNYFEDRDAMVRALFETRRATLRPKLLAAIGAGKELAFEPRLRTFMRALFQAFEEHRRYVKVVFSAEHLKPQGSHADLRAAVAEMVVAGVAEGVIAKSSAEIVEIMLIGSLRAVLVHRVETGGSFPEVADAVVSLVLDGARRKR